MFFVDDVVFIDEMKDIINNKFEESRDTLKSKGFRMSRTTTEYLDVSSMTGRNSEFNTSQLWYDDTKS